MFLHLCAVDTLDDESLKLWNMVMGSFLRETAIINSQNVIIALLMRLRFTKMEKKDELLKCIDTEKHGVVLDLIGNFLDLKKNPPFKYRDRVLEIFQEAARAWILVHTPKNIELDLTFADTSSSTVPFEHPLHVCMSYYCNSQGILYAKKGDMIRCDVHERHRVRVQEMEKTEADTDPIEMRMAKVYAESEYDALLILCANRVFKDALFGNTRGESEKLSSAEDRQRHAEDLLVVARQNHQMLLTAKKPADSKPNPAVEDAASAETEPEANSSPCDNGKGMVVEQAHSDANKPADCNRKGMVVEQKRSDANKKKVPPLDLSSNSPSSGPKVPAAPNAQKKTERVLHFK